MFQTVEVLVHMYDLLIFQSAQCQNEVEGENVSKQRTESTECLLAKTQFLEQGNHLNYQYHVSQLLKMYAGELNLLGMDYFAQV